MIKNTLLLLTALTFLAVNTAWAGHSSTSGISICGLKDAVFDDAKDGKKEDGEKKEDEEEPDCE